MVKNLPARQELQVMGVGSLDWEDPLEEDMATHSSILPGESYGQRSLAASQSTGSQSQIRLKRLSTHACIGSCYIIQ